MLVGVELWIVAISSYVNHYTLCLFAVKGSECSMGHGMHAA